MCCWFLRKVLSGCASLALVGIMACGAILGGCMLLPVAEYSSFGDPEHTRVGVIVTTPYWDPPCDGAVVVAMEPKENRSYRREGLSIEDFQSPTGSQGKAFIHYPKGIMQLKLVAYDVNKADSDMIFKWKVVQKKLFQKGQVVQEMQVRLVPGPPVRVFVNEQEIRVHDHWLEVH